MRAHLALFAAVVAVESFASSGWAEVRYSDDATLRSVQFIDANEGWAVGDEGVICHTVNGGKTWETQQSGVRGSLRSVCMVMPFRGEGWIAGREERQHGGSVSILLSTKNGGASWKRQLANGLPGLNAVRFTGNPNVGFLLGDGCDVLGSGLFRTTDAGLSWEPVPGPRTASWLAGEFADDRNGILCGAWSGLANIEQGVLKVADVDARLDSRRAIFSMQVLPQRILAVGQGGLILSSVSRGKKWNEVDAKLSQDLRASIDFQAIHSIGGKVWIVGRPGSVVLASDDQGVTWKWHGTGQNMPLHGLFFLDDKRGWAVGDAGTILHTADGGSTWTVQRQGGKRAALLCVHARPEKLDVDTLAHVGADEGYLSVALRCTIPVAGGDWKQAAAAQRFAAGARLAGGMTGETLWQLPLPQYLASVDKKRIHAYWSELHGSDAGRQIVRQLVLALRMWRPSVVIGDPLQPRLSGSEVSSLLGEALQAALVQASDPSAFPEQIDQLGLQPWRVARYYAGWEKKNASVTLDSCKVSDRLEGSYREFAGPAARLLTEQLVSLPTERCYRLLGSAPGVADAKFHLLEGLPQPAGEARRRELPRLTVGPEAMKNIRLLSSLGLLAEKHRNPDQILAQLGPLLNNVSEEQGGAAVLNMACQFARQGQWLLARETHLLLVQKYPTMPQAAESYRWLIRHGSSSEARRRHELGQFMMQTNVNFDPKKLGNPRDDAKPGMPIAQVNFLANPNEARQWYRGSVDLGARLSKLGVLYALDPSVQFCIQSSRRQLGELEPVQHYCSRGLALFPHGPWRDAAGTELWLMGKGGVPGKLTASCRFTEQKPQLDGDFDDVCWKDLRPIVLQNAAGDTGKEYATQAWLAFDQEFLYLALRCERPAGEQAALVKNRQRDADLDAHDRVSILLDLDRDYATYFRLEVDQRGCVREDCGGDVSWNPKWFVAVKSTPAAWCVEAAIPLHELTGEHIQRNTVWACNVVRTLPGRGVQAWSLPADVQPRPEGMGVMLFTSK